MRYIDRGRTYKNVASLRRTPVQWPSSSRASTPLLLADMKPLQIALALWLASGTTNAFLKKLKGKDKTSDNNNGWAQFGFVPQPPKVAYRPVPAYGTEYGFAPQYPAYQPVKFPFGFLKGGPSLLGKFDRAPLTVYPAPYAPPPPPPMTTKFPAGATVPKYSEKPNAGQAPHSGRYIYPSAYLPAYYVRLDQLGYPPAPPPREPLLSKISKLGKLRKGEAPAQPGYPLPFQGNAYGQLGQGRPVPLPDRSQPQGLLPQPPLEGHSAGASSYPRRLGKPIGTSSADSIPCEHDRYHDVGGKWTENPPYKYTGHHFGVPLKDGDAKNSDP